MEYFQILFSKTVDTPKLKPNLVADMQSTFGFQFLLLSQMISV